MKGKVMKVRFLTLVVAAFYIAACPAAFAQLSNKPFQFSNSNDGLGMSVGGKQAIINEKIYGITTDNLLRSGNGTLLSVEKGHGGSPIVRYNGTNEILVGYKGTSFAGNNEAMKHGVFNSFFTQDIGSNSVIRAATPNYAAINTWTKRIAADGEPVIYMDSGYDAIDAWTGQAQVLTGY